MMRIRVLLVDDHTVVRQGFRRILETDEAIEIVGEASDGESAIEMASRLHPDVVVMDIGLSDLNGIEATRRIVERDKEAKVLILTMLFDEVSVGQSLKAGARGYLLKDAEDLDLLKAVQAIGRGVSAFSPLVSQVVLKGYLGEAAGRDVADNLALLTGQEREVLQLIAEGKFNREIAAVLSVSSNTVELHRRRLMEKLGLHNTAEIVRFAFRKRLVT
jgi:two-component system, NarL family, response regulator NreC